MTQSIYTLTLANGLQRTFNVDNVNPTLDASGNVLSNIPYYTAGISWPTSTIRNALFDTNYYMTTYGATVAAEMAADKSITDPLDHFFKKGITYGFSPNSSFNAQTYLSSNPDVAAQTVVGGTVVAGVAQIYPNAVYHYMMYHLTDTLPANASIIAADASANLPAALKTLWATADRSTAGSATTYTFTANQDNFIAGAAPTNFTGTDTTVQANDTVDGTASSKSTLNVTMAANVAAVTVKNVGTANLTATNAATYDATNTSGVTTINSNGSTASLTVSNLGFNPNIGLISTGTTTTTVGYTAAALPNNTQTVNVNLNNLSNTSGSILALNNAASGFFGTVHVNSMGASTATNYLNTTNGLGGTALVGATALKVGTTATDGSAAVVMGVASAVNTIRNVTAASKADITFNDATTGSAAGGLGTSSAPSTFAVAGSKVKFASTVSPTANYITFTGTGNALGMTSASANTIGTGTTALANITNMDTLEITNALNSATLNMNYLGGTAVTHVNLNVGVNGASSITNLVNNAVINLGTSLTATGNAATTNALTTNLKTPGISNSITYNILGNTDAAVASKLTFNGVGTANVNLTTSITTQTVTFTLATDIGNKVVVTGGGAGSTIAHSGGGVLGYAGTFDASGAASNVTLTSNASGSNILGSHTGINSFTTGASYNNFTGGAAADTFTITGNAGTAGKLSTVQGHYNEINVANTYVFKAAAASATLEPVTISDFNPGTNSTAVDLIQISYGTVAAGGVAYMTGAGNASVGAAAAAVIQTVSSSTATTLNSTTNFVNYTASTVANAAAMQAIVQAAGTKFTFGATVSVGTRNVMPIAYYDGSNTHLAILTQVTNAGIDTSTGVGDATITDIALLTGVNNTYLDSTDISWIA